MENIFNTVINWYFREIFEQHFTFLYKYFSRSGFHVFTFLLCFVQLIPVT